MDRRTRKTKRAILEAFTLLLTQKSYAKISVQDIIDKADVGRTTFYAHFETKDMLLQTLVEGLFTHVFPPSLDLKAKGKAQPENAMIEEVISHLLVHFLNPDINFVALLSSESGSLFARYFKDRFGLALGTLIPQQAISDQGIPPDFVANYATSAFLGMVEW